MISLKIDNRIIEVEEGTPLHKAALKAGVEIPLMCYYDGMEHFTSCMVCMVKDRKNGKLLPSCSVKAMEGMDIITDDPEVKESRKTALELLLSEHVGDCEAPCKITCPAHMDIPLMNRLLANGEFATALEVVKKDIALPSVLGRICPAPCEGACRRKFHDEPVSICLLKRFAGDNDLDKGKNFLPEISPKTGFKIAIIGSGPAGLSAGYYLRTRGHQVDIYEKQAEAGGALRTAIPADILPKNVIDKEIGIIEKMGVRFFCHYQIDNYGFNGLLKDFDALIIACQLEEKDIILWGMEFSGTGIKADKETFQTNIKKVFAVGSALRTSKMAIRSLGQGKEAAFSVDQFLKKEEITGEPQMFNSRFGKLFADEYVEYLKESVPYTRIQPEMELNGGFTVDEVMREAARCLRCDCREKKSCLLRIYSNAYKANQKRFASEERKNIKKFDQHSSVIYEPAKCIKCGICVRITSLHKEEFGFTFIGRGFNVEIGVPFNEELKSALTSTADEVVLACPTGALAMKQKKKLIQDRYDKAASGYHEISISVCNDPHSSCRTNRTG